MDNEGLGLRGIMLLIIAIQIFVPISAMFMRINYYFLMFIPLLVIKTIKAAKKELKEVSLLANVVMSLFFTVYFFVNGYVGADILQIFPYVPMWVN